MAKKKVEEETKVVKPDIKTMAVDRMKQMRDAQAVSRKAQLKRQVEMLDARIEQMTKVRENTQSQLDKMG